MKDYIDHDHDHDDADDRPAEPWVNELMDQVFEKIRELSIKTCTHARTFLEYPRFIVGPDLGALTRVKAMDPPPPSSPVVMVWTEPETRAYRSFARWIDLHNQQHFGTLLTAYHPDDPLVDPSLAELLKDRGICLITLVAMEDYQQAYRRPPEDLTPTQLIRHCARRSQVKAFAPALAQGFRERDEVALRSRYDGVKH